MIEVFIQNVNPSARLDKLRYWKKSEASAAQKLQPELEALLVKVGRYKTMSLIASLGSHLMGNYFGPWKLVLMRNTEVTFTLEYSPTQTGSDSKEVESEVVRVSRYDRPPVI
jgi:hypothetical protein